ncbi:hypothetical protein [Methanocalculus chunghsingensis]|uniref:hypothetical protein n=1 Tax=Methanocalculus chunghsingensis TaxID=156457 RepID=UPI001B8AA9F7|nr:hypothetical protein [Methanocalculus chunghsingensis]
MKFLEHELEEKERELVKVKREEEPPREADDTARVIVLERRVRELEAMQKGLMEELLDLKSVTRKLARSVEEREKEEIQPVLMKAPDARPRSRAASEGVVPQVTVRRTARAPAAEVPPEPEEEIDRSDMDLIMQPDGTLKPEKRSGNDYIVASSGYAPASQMKKGRISSNIYEAPDVDPKSGAVISSNHPDEKRPSETIRRKK